MQDFAVIYRRAFDLLGYPLTQSHALPGTLIDRTERRLGASIPLALREYFLVAGNEKRFNRANHRFLHPSKWFVDRSHLVFLEENQSVCWWGVSTRTRAARDPFVSQGVNNDEIMWRTENQKCSTFLAVMLHYQAVAGGFRYRGSVGAPDDLHEMLKGWNYIGEVNQLWAFNRPNQVVCVMASSLPFMPAIVLLAGGKTKRDLRSIEESLAVKLP